METEEAYSVLLLNEFELLFAPKAANKYEYEREVCAHPIS